MSNKAFSMQYEKSDKDLSIPKSFRFKYVHVTGADFFANLNASRTKFTGRP